MAWARAAPAPAAAPPPSVRTRRSAPARPLPPWAPETFHSFPACRGGPWLEPQPPPKPSGTRVAAGTRVSGAGAGVGRASLGSRPRGLDAPRLRGAGERTLRRGGRASERGSGAAGKLGRRGRGCGGRGPAALPFPRPRSPGPERRYRRVPERPGPLLARLVLCGPGVAGVPAPAWGFSELRPPLP